MEDLLREFAPQVLAVLIRRFRDFSSAEDAVQEALLAAAKQWPAGGIPDNPRAWLIQVASRRVTDAIRAESARRRRESVFVEPAEAVSFDSSNEEDDTLLLLFMCCHPALSKPSAIALTLRAVGGLTTAEIASAFLVPEPTMAQRISRAKAAIKSSGVPFSMPEPREREERLAAVLHVLYLIFNEGYTSSGGPRLHRPELSVEAIRLARLTLRLAPGHAETAGLLALMLLTDARRPARLGPQGELVPLTRQDRSLWDRAAIGEGLALISAVLPKGTPGPYQLQAAIAAVHDEAARVEDTDWPQILALYDVLLDLADNPVVRLNRAIAVAMVKGPRAGLELLSELDREQRLADRHRLYATRGHLLELAGDWPAAIEEYGRAASLATNITERDYLLTQAARLREAV